MRALTTLAEREAAFALVRDGWRLVDIEAAFGIPKMTLSRWKNHPPARLLGSEGTEPKPHKKKNHLYMSRAPKNSGAVAACTAWRQDTDEHGWLVKLALAWPLYIAPSGGDDDLRPRLDPVHHADEWDSRHIGYWDASDWVRKEKALRYAKQQRKLKRLRRKAAA